MTDHAERPSIFEQSYPVRSFEVDFTGLLRPVALLNYLQDIAGEHADRLGFGVRTLLERGLTWVLSRSHTRILHYPRQGETLRVATWPSARQGVFALRDFEVHDGQGRVVALSSSSWALLNIQTMRPVRLEGNLPDYPTRGRRALEVSFDPLPELTDAELELPFRVRLADLDINLHVNNAIYAAWALEAVPEEVLKTFRPEEIEIGFRSPAFYGDRILSRSRAVGAADAPCFLHQLLHEQEARELTRLRTRWRPLGEF
ncbi:acyl-ACP thioesterase [Desulfuromonas versatilis]|uniref:Acyl-ACP thioesterase n=1 Tax=Desulfuromonas versatilis TaxID=2802975 RepID=A0ABM8HN98_9BACT|nr:acyl-ACP thioesterase domain-containing protein [Desulfuromonas versatilis]BCR04205.1 acyl-ACP thioesterase [Desulfuromonas versatilis]